MGSCDVDIGTKVGNSFSNDISSQAPLPGLITTFSNNKIQPWPIKVNGLRVTFRFSKFISFLLKFAVFGFC